MTLPAFSANPAFTLLSVSLFPEIFVTFENNFVVVAVLPALAPVISSVRSLPLISFHLTVNVTPESSPVLVTVIFLPPVKELPSWAPEDNVKPVPEVTF